MPKSRNQKLKLLYIKEMLEKETDENNKLTVKDIIDRLDDLDIKAERKSVYDDIEYLIYHGVDIICEKSNSNQYFVASREFELAEVKLLVDIVQSSKFLTEKKSNSLIKKIETLCSKHEAESLQRQVFVSNRVKNMNESIYITVDMIQNAISQGHKINFKYLNYSISDKKVLKKNGEPYIISPFALIYDEEKYYLLGYDSENEMFKHYRVDKIIDIVETDENNDGIDEFKNIDLGKYNKHIFSMFGGEVQKIKLDFDNSILGSIIDRFGKNLIFQKIDENTTRITCDVAVSNPFFGWLTSFGEKIKLVSPENVVNDYKQHLQKITKNYN